MTILIFFILGIFVGQLSEIQRILRDIRDQNKQQGDNIFYRDL